MHSPTINPHPELLFLVDELLPVMNIPVDLIPLKSLLESRKERALQLNVLIGWLSQKPY